MLPWRRFLAAIYSTIMSKILSKTQLALGTIWIEPSEKLASSDNNDQTPVRVCFRNHSLEPLFLCWMDAKGNPHHFYQLKPTRTQKNTEVTSRDHIEQTRIGHVFCIARPKQKGNFERKEIGDIVAAYQPNDGLVHLVTIEYHPDNNSNDNIMEQQQNCCRPKRRKLRGPIPSRWKLTVQPATLDPTPVDNTKKKYIQATLGGWPIYMEPDWHENDVELQQQLEQDIQYAASCLPSHARDLLRRDTSLYINKSIKYGSKASPMRGKGLCYHTGTEWLKENGMSTAKAMCIELYNAKDYKTDRLLWGKGGVILHELCHAYHHKILPKGYDNPDIIACYQHAMKKKLYEKVRVHGIQGPTARAYACTNAMEYWAELSTALLGGTDKKEEYNKWFPFNKQQLASHDVKAYDTFCKLWKLTK